jgi:hypothetical protein
MNFNHVNKDNDEDKHIHFKPKKEELPRILEQHNRLSHNISNTAPEPEAEPEIGEKMKDGTVFAGISPESGEKMFTTPRSSSLTMSFNEAAEYAVQLNKEKYLGHDDWRVPTKAELRVLFEHQYKGELKGTFNLLGGPEEGTSGLYWSSTPGSSRINAECIRFNVGAPELYYKGAHLHLRCVR